MTNNNYFRIFVSDLNEYCDGRLNGEWLSLPLSDEQLEDALNRISVDDYDELFITDFENSFDAEVGEYDDIYNLNRIASEIINFDDEQRAAFIACMDDGMDFDDAVEKVESHDYMAYPDIHDMSDVAYQELEESGEINRIPDELQPYFDYEAFGRDMETNGNFFDTDYGYIELI